MLFEKNNILKKNSLDDNKYFAQPVDEIATPNYRQVITNPMDFETMEKKALNSEYLEDSYNLPKYLFSKKIS